MPVFRQDLSALVLVGSLVLLLSQGQAAVNHPSPAHQMMIQIHPEIHKSQCFIAVLYFCITHLIIIPNGV